MLLRSPTLYSTRPFTCLRAAVLSLMVMLSAIQVRAGDDPERIRILERKQKLGPSGSPEVRRLLANHCGSVVQTPGELHLCNHRFVLDGDIREFIHYEGDSQNYFITDRADANFGKLRDGASVCSDMIALDTNPRYGSERAGEAGFDDSPIQWGGVAAPTGFNVGRVFLTFDSELDPDGDPTNGTGVYFIAVDVSAPAELDRAFGTQSVAFDIDGDGSRVTQEDVFWKAVGEAPPAFEEDLYFFGLDTNNRGSYEVIILLTEQTEDDQNPGGPSWALSVDPGGQKQIIEGQTVRRRLEFLDSTALLPGSPEQQAVRFMDVTQDGMVDWRDIGVGDDIEFAVLNASALPRNDDPFNLRIRVIADGAADVLLGGGEDSVLGIAVIPAGAGVQDRCRDTSSE